MVQDPLIKERERERKRFDRQERARARAEAYFNIYYELGVERSLARLHEYLGAVGVKISMTTLESYSSKYGWQVEIAKRDTQLAETRRKQQAESIAQMEERHIEMARAAQRALIGGLKHYLDAITQGRPKEMAITDITKAMKDAVTIERTARGEPAERKELLIQIDNMWILTVTQIFLAVNDFPTAQMRVNEFGNRLQQFVDNRSLELGSDVR